MIIFVTGTTVGWFIGSWRGALLCGVFSFFMAAIYGINDYLGEGCVYELKQRDPKSAEKLLNFLKIIFLPLFIIILLATILASIKLCELFGFCNQ